MSPFHQLPLTSPVESALEMMLKSFPPSHLALQACLDPCYPYPRIMQWPIIRVLLSQIIHHFDAIIIVVKVQSDFNFFT